MEKQVQLQIVTENKNYIIRYSGWEDGDNACVKIELKSMRRL
jgi:hypothetical protein